MRFPSKIAAAGLLAAGLMSLSPAPSSAQELINPPPGYRLDLARAKVCHAAMMAVMKDARTDEALRAEMSNSDVEFQANLDGIVAEWQRIAPTAARRMDASDCDSRSYWIGTLVMIQSMAFAAAIDEVPEMEADLKGSMTPDLAANFELYRADRAAYEGIIMEMMEAESALFDGQ